MKVLYDHGNSVFKLRYITFFIVLLVPFQFTIAQTNLKQLLENTVKNYPSIAAKIARVEASKADLKIEKNTFLPSLDVAYQASYATFNNITGMSYPGVAIPISGPPSSDNEYDGVPGSAASVLLKWEPITFGQRAAAIMYNEKLYEKELAGVEDEILKVQYRVALTYLEIATTEELIKAYDKNIERTEYNVKQVNSLVTAGIRPGVDSLQFKGELSRARTELYGLQNILENQKQELVELLVGQNFDQLAIDPFYTTTLPGLPLDLVPMDTIRNPVLRMAEYDAQANEALLSKFKRAWAPKLEFWGTGYGRGSGIRFDGTVNQSEGWSFTRYNYGFGAQLIFPILGLREKSLKVDKQEALLQSSLSNLNRTEIELKKQENTAVGDFETSLKVAREIPLEFEAKEAAYHALRTRYETGLIDYTDLIQAQYELLSAESRLGNAYVSTWKMLLKLAIIRGDISIFENQL